ncbi:trypsin-like peptidase domain-containing protein [Pseudonocardia sp. KRD291]|uniref:trypsin-like peptidase domain-containing protein n=1 Tax=Pseudonocardia sp. KRD291 TaxID=2792007 RepID=UPI001C4A452C|nr:trypsin-like peptidase domain-containing protein [Pseudonocardia sp. KRD291]MBW0101456.1 trypsin-like peptidase domain-containing protein [Pseudonocardia sp. KRD291]
MPQDTPHGDGDTGRTTGPSPEAEDATPTPDATPSDGEGMSAGPSGDGPSGDAAPSDGAPSDGASGAGSNPWARPGQVGEPAQTGAPTEAPGDGAGGPTPQAADSQGQYPQAQATYGPGQYAQYPQNPYGPAAPGQYGTGQYAPGQYGAGQHGAAQYPTGQYPQAPYAQAPYAAGGQPPYGTYPPGATQPGWAGGPPPPSRRGRGGRLVAAGIALALVAGGVGGAIGTEVATSTGSGDGGVLGGPLPEADSDLPLTPIEQVAQKVLPSVVQLRVEGGALSRGEQGEGSGMVVSGDGLVLTNNHVVEPAATGGTLRAIFQDGRTASMRIIGRDPQSDLAVVKADDLPGLRPIELGNSEGVRVGQQVTAIGSPLGLGGSVTTGIVSALNRAVSVGGESGPSSATVLSALQTDAAINPGNSGGPLVDMQGRVVGINSAIATTGGGGGSIGVGFSIPINQAKRVADQLRTTGKATHAVLGVEVTDDPQQTGARLRTVAPGGAAATAGLKPNDLVVRLGDQRITTGTDLQAAVRSQAPGSTVEMQLADRTVQVVLGEN